MTLSPNNASLATEYLLLAALATLWGSSYLLIKLALTSIPPITLMAIRVTLAAAFLLLVMRWRGERLPRDAQSLRELFVQSLLNSSLAWLVLAWGQQYLDSGLAGVLNSTSPLFVFLLTLRTTPRSTARVAGVVLGFVGVVLVIGWAALGSATLHSVLPQAAVLFGAFLYACAALNGKRLAQLSPLATAAGTMLWASACLLPLSLFVDQPWTIQPKVSSVIASLTLAFACTGVALIIYFRLIKTLGAMGVASQSYLRAGISVLLGLAILGEQPSATVLVGLVVIILGVVLINRPIKPVVIDTNQPPLKSGEKP